MVGKSEGGQQQELKHRVPHSTCLSPTLRRSCVSYTFVADASTSANRACSRPPPRRLMAKNPLIAHHPQTASVARRVGQKGEAGRPGRDACVRIGGTSPAVSARSCPSCYALRLSVSFLPFTNRFRHSMSTGFHSMSAPPALPYSVAFPR